MANLHISEDFKELIKSISESKYIYAREFSRWTQNFASWTTTPLKLSTANTNDSSMFIHDSVNNKIKIGAGVSQVEITALVNWLGISNTGEFDIQITKNGFSAYMLYNEPIKSSDPNLNNIGGGTIPSFILDVQEGDEIQLCMFGNITSATILRSHLLLKQIK